MPNKAIFFDRDGTLNVDVHYLHDPEQFVWVDGAIDAIRWANTHGYLVIVVTNQSGIARGYYDEAAVQRLHDWIMQSSPSTARISTRFTTAPIIRRESFRHIRRSVPAASPRPACSCARSQNTISILRPRC